ncbi:MAG: acetylxylan esterase [Candidatus Margulisiibacteriota bacterium]
MASPEALSFKSLWQQTSIETGASLIKQYSVKGLRVKEVYYSGRPQSGQATRIFGYYCYPEHFTPLPALLIAHGGGGSADINTALRWARYGYAVLVIDLPGKGKQRRRSRSTGPDMDVKNLLNTADPASNYLLFAVAAARNGIDFLSKQPEVDRNKIGMMGLSWGGVLTLLTNGQEPRLKAAVNVFGAGFIPEGCTWQEQFRSKSHLERVHWNKLLDPSNFLASQRSPILFITGTNDHCYYLHTFQKSYDRVKMDKQFYLVPNLRHQFSSGTAAVARTWFDRHLKVRRNFPKVNLLYGLAPGGVTITAEVSSDYPTSNVRLYYATGKVSGWTRKSWQKITGTPENNKYTFFVPGSLIAPEIVFFVSAVDNEWGASSTLARSLFRLALDKKQVSYAVSAPISRLYDHQAPYFVLSRYKMPKRLKLAYSISEEAYRINPLPEPRQARGLLSKWFFFLKVRQVSLIAPRVLDK